MYDMKLRLLSIRSFSNSRVEPDLAIFHGNVVDDISYDIISTFRGLIGVELLNLFTIVALSSDKRTD